MSYVPQTPIDSYPTMPCEDISEQKYNKCNCPNCGAPVNGPICEYCGSVLSNGKIEQTQKQFAKAKWAWEESVIQAELMQNVFQQSQQKIKYDLQSQICCDTRTQINNSIIQSPDYIPRPVPLVIEEKRTKDLGFKLDASYVLVWVIVMLLIAAPIAALIAPFLA